MTIGYMDDASIRLRLADAVKNSKKNAHTVILSCLWNSSDMGLQADPWEVRLQCTRRASPAILIEALAMGAKAVFVKGCDEGECHYLPGPWMGPDVVESCREILDAIDIAPERISYIGAGESDAVALEQISDLKPFKPMAGKMPECGPTNSGHWPLYRYRPGAADGAPFQLDSKAPSIPFGDFAQKEARFSMLFRSDPARAKELMARSEEDIAERWRYYEQLAGVQRAAPLPDPDGRRARLGDEGESDE